MEEHWKRRFHEKATEHYWWKTISDTNTDISVGLGFVGWGLAKPLARSNAYTFTDGTGKYINSAKPAFRVGRLNIDFNLRGANRIVSGIRSLGITSGIASGLMTAAEIWQSQKNIIGEGGLDLIMTGVGFFPGYGWAISSAYFLGKSALEYNDLDFWNK